MTFTAMTDLSSKRKAPAFKSTRSLPVPLIVMLLSGCGGGDSVINTEGAQGQVSPLMNDGPVVPTPDDES